MKKIKLLKLIKNFRYRLSLNLKYFIVKNLGSRVNKYKFIGFNAGWIIGKIKKSYLSIHLRPKNSRDVKYSNNSKKNNSDFGVILQGPISVNGDKGEFLYETLKIYKKIFYNCNIVLSTWKIDEKLKKKFEALEIKIIENVEPNDENFGTVRNIDRQILTTYSALKYLNEKKVIYSLKTRTDWRMYKPDVHHFLKNILNTFPIKNNYIKGRIIIPSMITCKFKIYGMADTLQFGFTEDLIKLWDKEYFLDSINRLSFGKYPSLINHTPVISDVFLCARFLSKINHNLLWTLEDWWDVLSNYFCVIDTDSLDLIWTKYEDWFYEKRYYRTYNNEQPRSVEFSDWINLYKDQKNTSESWKNLGFQEKWNILNNEEIKLEKFY